jgi:hypothetical protein
MVYERIREQKIKKIKKEMNAYILQRSQWVNLTYGLRYYCFILSVPYPFWCLVFWHYYRDYLSATMYSIVPSLITSVILLATILISVRLHLKIIKVQYRKQHAEEYLFLRQEGIDP